MSYIADPNQTTMKISELCLSERPREKLFQRGCGSLSDAELLAILIRTGTRKESAIDVAQRLLAAAEGSLLTLSNFSLEQLCGIDGIKEGKAPAILAAIELGRRFMNSRAAKDSSVITNPEKTYRLMLPHLKGLEWEECWIMLLDAAMKLVAKKRMTVGCGDSTIIDKKDIIREALAHKAKFIILSHNHPGSNPMPSEADIEMTGQLAKAAREMDLTLLDHVIVCDDSFYSFSDERMIKTL